MNGLRHKGSMNERNNIKSMNVGVWITELPGIMDISKEGNNPVWTYE